MFAGQADFAQMIKIYGDYGQHDAAGRYSPSLMMEIIIKIRDGRPDPRHISTSYVERQNLTIRMAIRRFTRLTNAFSKKLDNHKAACALHFAYYNFCRIQQKPSRNPCDGSWHHRSHLDDCGTVSSRIESHSMETKCYWANSPNSDAPICGLHQKPLIEQTLPREKPQGLASGVLVYNPTAFVCPVTKEIVSRF